MNPQQIFGLQVLLSFLVYGLVARWYVTPRLASRPLHAALQPLLGPAYFIPTFIVPALVITHVMMFRMLVRHPR
jgi:hypothetical protein